MAAHSTVRALYGKYHGPLYTVQKDQESLAINTLAPGGFADKASHDKFCAKLDCVILSVMDQVRQCLSLTFHCLFTAFH